MADQVYNNLSELLAKGEGKKGIKGIALLSSVEESKTQNNKPFVRGVLSDAKEEIPFKEWDITLENFRKKNGLSGTKPEVVWFTGDLEFYQMKPQVILRPQSSSNSQTVVIDKTVDISGFVKKSYIDPRAMWDTIKGQLGSIIGQNTEILNVAKAFMDEAQKAGALYVPYSPVDHTEKGGWLQHTYNCISKVMGLKGDPKEGNLVPVANKGVMVALVLCHHFSSFTSMKVDEITGTIEEANNLELVQTGYKNVKFLDKLISSTRDVSEDTAIMLTEGVAAINGLIPPNSLESLIAKQIVSNELDQHRFYSAIRALQPNELRIIEMFDGTKTTVCGRG